MAAPEPIADRDRERRLGGADGGAGDGHTTLHERPEHREEALVRILDRTLVAPVLGHVRIAVEQGLAGDAHFALAESYYGQDNCPEALPEYGQLIKSFSKSKSVPLAYVRSGDCFARLKNPEAARLAYEQVVKDYPRSAEAKMAQKGLSALKKSPPAKGKK